MGIETERKFLVVSDSWKTDAAGLAYLQGYLMTGSGVTVRVRVAGAHGFLTVKGPSRGASRDEYEYEIPEPDARTMIRELCRSGIIEKTRFAVRYAGRDWVVDEFAGRNLGLIVAEVELDDPEAPLHLPPWVGEEVTEDGRYYNVYLAEHPYSTWSG